MRDITLKPTTLRSATATGAILLPPETLAKVRAGAIEKGDVAETARIAGLMAVKRVPDLLPHCHPINVLQSEVRATIGDDRITVEAEVQTVASTGVEMEALSAVSVALLTVYDMLKAYAPAEAMVITDTRLLKKRGGKTQFGRRAAGARAAVVVLSDTVASGTKPDTAGASVRDGLGRAGFAVDGYEVLPDEPEALRSRLEYWLAQRVELIVTVGGTGLGPRDLTVATVQPFLDLELPGFMEAARAFGQARTPYAMLSRGIAGLSGPTFIATFPGSRKGAEETLAAVLPGLVHLIDVCRIARPHEGGYQ
jgi:molybdenum cofactor biosynthesis protein MoaC